jgi:large subunit ribosomal protein L9
MKVILTKDVLSLGETGDIVDVSDGYARNYLLPSGFAEKATDGALKKREQNLARIKAKAEKIHKQAMDTADSIKSIGKITIQAKAGETGKLYGAITTRQLTQIIKEKTDKEVDRRNITLNNPVNHVGEYVLTVKLTSKVSVDIPIEVTAGSVQEPMMTEEFKQEIEEMEQEKQQQLQDQQEQYQKSQEEEQQISQEEKKPEEVAAE